MFSCSQLVTYFLFSLIWDFLVKCIWWEKSSLSTFSLEIFWLFNTFSLFLAVLCYYLSCFYLLIKITFTQWKLNGRAFCVQLVIYREVVFFRWTFWKSDRRRKASSILAKTQTNVLRVRSFHYDYTLSKTWNSSDCRCCNELKIRIADILKWFFKLHFHNSLSSKLFLKCKRNYGLSQPLHGKETHEVYYKWII